MAHPETAAHEHRSRLLAVLALTAAVMAVEVAGGLAANSLALLADAGHMLTDVAGIALALFAVWMAARPADRTRTFGYLRLEILAAVANAVLLFGVAAFVLWEAWQRLAEPPSVGSDLMVAVAVLGLAVNAVSMRLLHDGQQASLNLRAAYLEVMGDFAGSAAVVVAGLVIAVTGWTTADLVASALIALLILPRTWRLLRDATDVLLEATPRGLDMTLVRSHILEAPGVVDVHDLHAWTITSGVNVVSAHVVIGRDADAPSVLDHLCGCLSGFFDIEHSTFQLEAQDRSRLEAASHP